MADRYVLGQGKVYLDEINASTGKAKGKAVYVGNVPTGGLTIGVEVQKIQHKESNTGKNLTDLVIERQIGAMGKIVFENIDKQNLLKAFYGTATAISGSTVSAETHTAYKSTTENYSFRLNKVNLTSFTSLTNNAADATYTLGTDYTVDLKTGMVTILASGSTITDASTVKANYVAGTSEVVAAMDATNTEYYLLFDGINNAQNDDPIIFEGFRCRLQPAKSLDLINENVTNLDCDFELLYQSLLADTAQFEGGFFRIIQKQAA